MPSVSLQPASLRSHGPLPPAPHRRTSVPDSTFITGSSLRKVYVSHFGAQVRLDPGCESQRSFTMTTESWHTGNVAHGHLLWGGRWEGAYQVLIRALVMVFIRALVSVAVMCGRLLAGEGLEYFVRREGEKY